MHQFNERELQELLSKFHLTRSKNNTIDFVVRGPLGEYIVVEAMRCNTIQEQKTQEENFYKIAQDLELKKIDVAFCDTFIDNDNNILLPDKRIVLPSEINIITPVAEINERLMRYIAEHPEAMRELHWRRFEEMVAELFRKMGFTVEVTQPTKDGGKDIYIARNEVYGKVLYLVECKKNAPDRPVGVQVIRNMYGVLGMDERKPTGGIIATTSYFSKDAQKEVTEKRLDNRLFLHDYNGLTELMKRLYLG